MAKHVFVASEGLGAYIAAMLGGAGRIGSVGSIVKRYVIKGIVARIELRMVEMLVAMMGLMPRSDHACDWDCTWRRRLRRRGRHVVVNVMVCIVGGRGKCIVVTTFVWSSYS